MQARAGDLAAGPKPFNICPTVRIGYDAARLGSLSAGRLLEPGGPVFGASLGRAEFELALRAQAA